MNVENIIRFITAILVIASIPALIVAGMIVWYIYQYIKWDKEQREAEIRKAVHKKRRASRRVSLDKLSGTRT